MLLCEASFHMLVCHLYIFFGEVSVKVFGSFFNHFVFLLLSFKGFIYFLDNIPLWDVACTNIFSYSVACLFIPLTLSFPERKFLILMTSSVSVISLINCAFGVVSNKSSPYPKELLPVEVVKCGWILGFFQGRNKKELLTDWAGTVRGKVESRII